MKSEDITAVVLQDSKVLGEEVTWVNLHTPFFAPGIGNKTETLSATVVGMDKSLKMYLDGTVLRVFMKGFKLGIPVSNIKAVVFK